jgi:hypothetical protein
MTLARVALDRSGSSVQRQWSFDQSPRSADQAIILCDNRRIFQVKCLAEAAICH